MIYIVGDLHGDKNRIIETIEQIPNPSEDDKIIVCGDAGFEYGDMVMGNAKKAASKFPGSWIIMRGNHDNRYWRDHSVDPKWHLENMNGNSLLVQDKYPNIKYVRDTGGIYYIDDYKFFFAPGAYSVDKDWRLLKNLPYEPEEQLTTQEFYVLADVASLNKDDIDFVISHTGPHMLEDKIRYLFLDFIDQKRIDKTTERWLDEISDIIKDGNNFKHWFFGHYHDAKELDDKYTMTYRRVLRLEDYV